MATTRFIAMHQNKGKSIAACLSDRMDYAKNPEKTLDGQYITSYQCDPMTVQSEFLLAKRQYAQITGREQENNVIAYQIRQSFKPGEVTPELANQVGYELAMRFTKGNHAFIVATHIDKAHIHNHIIFNSTSLDCTKKFRDFLGSGKAVRRVSDLICLEQGLSIVENPKQSSKHYGTWLGDRKPVSFSEQIRGIIDGILERKPKDMEELLQELEHQGYEVKQGKYIAVKGKGQKKFIRFRSLGLGYSEEELRAVMNGEQVVHRPKRMNVKNDKVINLIVNIQAKLQAGKGAGYERWAKVFNLKQMAKTLIYLEENGIGTLEELEVKMEGVNKKFQELSEEIKELEERMSRISELQKYIVNYAKTREVYAEYREKGYSEEFYEEHVEELLVNKAAREAFGKLGEKKLPKMKELREEYGRMRQEKKEKYVEYRKVKGERKELGTVMGNVEAVLGDGKIEKNREERIERSES